MGWRYFLIFMVIFILSCSSIILYDVNVSKYNAYNAMTYEIYENPTVEVSPSGRCVITYTINDDEVTEIPEICIVTISGEKHKTLAVYRDKSFSDCIFTFEDEIIVLYSEAGRLLFTLSKSYKKYLVEGTINAKLREEFNKRNYVVPSNAKLVKTNGLWGISINSKIKYLIRYHEDLDDELLVYKKASNIVHATKIDCDGNLIFKNREFPNPLNAEVRRFSRHILINDTCIGGLSVTKIKERSERMISYVEIDDNLNLLREWKLQFDVTIYKLGTDNNLYFLMRNDSGTFYPHYLMKTSRDGTILMNGTPIRDADCFVFGLVKCRIYDENLRRMVFGTGVVYKDTIFNFTYDPEDMIPIIRDDNGHLVYMGDNGVVDSQNYVHTFEGGDTITYRKYTSEGVWVIQRDLVSYESRDYVCYAAITDVALDSEGNIHIVWFTCPTTTDVNAIYYMKVDRMGRRLVGPILIAKKLSRYEIFIAYISSPEFRATVAAVVVIPTISGYCVYMYWKKRRHRK